MKKLVIKGSTSAEILSKIPPELLIAVGQGFARFIVDESETLTLENSSDGEAPVSVIGLVQAAVREFDYTDLNRRDLRNALQMPFDFGSKAFTLASDPIKVEETGSAPSVRARRLIKLAMAEAEVAARCRAEETLGELTFNRFTFSYDPAELRSKNEASFWEEMWGFAEDVAAYQMENPPEYAEEDING